MTLFHVLLLIIASVVLIALLAYAVYLAVQLRQQNLRSKELALKRQVDYELRLEQIQKSIVILARALVQEELSMTEACIRIAYLMSQIKDHLSKDPGERVYSADDLLTTQGIGNVCFQDIYSEQVSQVFFQVAEATAHIPILDAWGALSREEQFAYDREREEIEANFDEFVLVAAQQLLE